MPFLHQSPSPVAGAAQSAQVDPDRHAPVERESAGADGSPLVTDRDAPGTSGGLTVTSGWTPRRVALAGLGTWLALLLVQCTANALSQASENPGRPPWPYWCWEITSAIGWMSVGPLLWQLVRRIPALARRPARLALWLVGGSILLSLVHIGTMMGLRLVTYRLLGTHYDPLRGPAETFLYEYRKDVSTLLQMGVGFYGIQWLMSRARQQVATDGRPPEPRAELIVEIQDGPATHFVPLAEIDLVSAAGNYVEIVWRGRTLLHRTTLTALEEAWTAHGFVRIHRSTLVRAAAILRLDTLKSGDFVLHLSGGAQTRGSRRYRATLSAAFASAGKSL